MTTAPTGAASNANALRTAHLSKNLEE
jgi:hypothetical protein